jgi:hypothetical protein
VRGRLVFMTLCCAIAASIAFIAPAPARGEGMSGAKFAARQKDYIAELLRRRDYFSCISETQRLLSCAEGTDRGEYGYLINACYYLGGRYGTAVVRTGSGPADFRTLLLRSSAYLRMEDYAEAERALESAAAPDEGARYTLLARKTELWLRSGDTDRAYREIMMNESLSGMQRYLRLREDFSACERLSGRSPALSAVMSAVIPGAGQLYSGRYLDAAISILATAGLATGAWYAYDRGHRGLAYTLGFFGVLTWTGSIYGAWNAAHAYNETARGEFARTIMKKHIPGYDPLEYCGVAGAR